MQRSMAVGHFYAYVVIGFITLLQETAIWDNTAGAFSVSFFFALAVTFGYLGYIARHARAQNVKVRLSADATREWATLKVHDDGQGFDPATVKEGMGMANIRSRCLACARIAKMNQGVRRCCSAYVSKQDAKAIAQKTGFD